MIEKTCGNCKNLIKCGERNWTFGCALTDSVIPHSADYQKGEIIFCRVPTSCPISDGSVLKSEKQAPKKDWVVKTVSDYK